MHKLLLCTILTIINKTPNRIEDTLCEAQEKHNTPSMNKSTIGNTCYASECLMDRINVLYAYVFKNVHSIKTSGSLQYWYT